MKKCKICPIRFNPSNSMQKVCSPGCAIEYAKSEQGKKNAASARKQETAVKKKAFRANDKSWHTKQAQIAVNKYVRLRDKGLACISCDKPDNGKHQRHASHYKSVGSNSALRFNLWNISASCSQCNSWKSGNIGEYTPRLIEKIGQEKYDWILTQNHNVKYSSEYLMRLAKVFRKRARVLEKRYNCI